MLCFWQGHLSILNVVDILLNLPGVLVDWPGGVIVVLALLNDRIPSSKARACVDGLSIGEIGHTKFDPGGCVFGCQWSRLSL